MAFCLPVLCFLLLAAVDFARVLSAQQHLSHAVHVITLRLIRTPGPSLSATELNRLVADESRLATATATISYARDAGGDVQAIVTAHYDYSLLLPGLQAIRQGSLSNGKLGISVQAAGVATTSAPVLAPSGAPPATPTGLTVSAPADGSAPGAATLTCAIYDGGGTMVASGSCSSGSPYTWTPSSLPRGTYTARILQPNSITSPPSPAVTIS